MRTIYILLFLMLTAVLNSSEGASQMDLLYANWRKEWIEYYASTKSVIINGKKVLLGYELNKYKEVLELPSSVAIISSEVNDATWDTFMKTKLEPFNKSFSASEKVIGDEFLAFMVCSRKRWNVEDLLDIKGDKIIGTDGVLYNYLKLPSLVLEKIN